jgi:hypothetical protein
MLIEQEFVTLGTAEINASSAVNSCGCSASQEHHTEILLLLNYTGGR